MQEYQIPALQQQLQSIKDLKRQYEAMHSSFGAALPESASFRGNDSCRMPGTEAQQAIAVREDGTPHPAKASQPPAARDMCDGAHNANTNGILTAMQGQVESLENTATLEQTAAFVLATELDRADACAVLTGQKARYYLHQGTVSVGRTSVYKGKVDIDLTLEGAGTNISRYTCFIDLDLCYGFLLHNIGKQVIRVNNVVVPMGHKIKLPHLSLLEVGGIALLFQINAEAIVRLCLKPPPCPA